MLDSENRSVVDFKEFVTRASLGEYAFSGCTGLTSITIPYNVKSIASSTFNLCSNLASVRFEGNAPSIVEGKAFDGISATVAVSREPESGFTAGLNKNWRSAFPGAGQRAAR